jgi:hypothetical protein
VGAYTDKAFGKAAPKIDNSLWILGGPSYELKLDARHAATLAAMVRVLGPRILGIQYRHGVPVEAPRNGLFEDALKSDAEFLLWCDSDCYGYDPYALISVGDTLRKFEKPMASVPVAQRNGEANIWITSNTKLSGEFKTLSTDLCECYAAGLGLAVFWLPWYREHWNEGPFFRTDWLGGTFYISEDFWHSRRLCDLGESAYYALASAVVHSHRGV